MAESFASILASRIQSHPEFWADLGTLQASAAISSISAKTDQNIPESIAANGGLFKLIYAASIFSQSANESNQALAQIIALSSLFVPHADPKLRERTESILADIGNFPAIGFIRNNFTCKASNFFSGLRVDLLTLMNSVQIGETELALTDFQHSLWEDLPTAESMAISAPTSGGKSFLLIEYLARRSIRDKSFTAVYIAPTRALLAEVYHRLAAASKGY